MIDKKFHVDKKLMDARVRDNNKIALARRDTIKLGLSTTQAKLHIAQIMDEAAIGYLSEVVALRSNVICENNMGFVSNYDMNSKIVKEKGFDGDSRFVYVKNNKKDDVVQQYKHARALCSNIENSSEQMIGNTSIFNESIVNYYIN